MIMKVAIPYWQGRVSPVFDESREMLLVNIENGREINRTEMKLKRTDPLMRARLIADLGTEVLICGAISLTLERALIAKKVKVVAYTRGLLDDVIAAFMNNRLSDPDFLMPGCYRKK